MNSEGRTRNRICMPAILNVYSGNIKCVVSEKRSCVWSSYKWHQVVWWVFWLISSQAAGIKTRTDFEVNSKLNWQLMQWPTCLSIQVERQQHESKVKTWHIGLNLNMLLRQSSTIGQLVIRGSYLPPKWQIRPSDNKVLNWCTASVLYTYEMLDSTWLFS